MRRGEVMKITIAKFRSAVCSNTVLITKFFMKEVDTVGFYLTHKLDSRLCLTRLDDSHYKITVLDRFAGVHHDISTIEFFKCDRSISGRRHVVAIKAVDELLSVVGGKMFDILYDGRMKRTKGRKLIANALVSFNNHLKSDMMGDLLNNPDQKDKLDKALIPYRHFYCHGGVDENVEVELVKEL